MFGSNIGKNYLLDGVYDEKDKIFFNAFVSCSGLRFALGQTLKKSLKTSKVISQTDKLKALSIDDFYHEEENINESHNCFYESKEFSLWSVSGQQPRSGVSFSDILVEDSSSIKWL